MLPRGLIVGAALTSLVGLVFCLVASQLPAWLVLRTELEENMCWEGEGIWQVRSFWGQDLPRIKLKCQDPEHLDGLSTRAAYCSDSPLPPLNELDPVDYAGRMCLATNKAKTMMLLASLTVGAATLIGFGLAAFGEVETSLGWPLAACALSFAGLVFAGVATQSMVGSPLFSKQHNDALSREQVGTPYNGFGCSFQTPLHNPLSYLLSSPLKCVFPGPAFASAILIFVCSGYATLFFLMHVSEVRQSRKRLQVYASGLPFQTIGTYNPTRFSVYNAVDRHFAYLPTSQRVALVILTPFLTMLGNAISWCLFLLYGSQIIGGADFRIAPLGLSVLVSAAPPTGGTIPDSFVALALEVLASPAFRALPEGRLYLDVANVFNFSPVVATRFFWDGGAYLVTVATLATILILPVGKVLLWIWFWFAPSDSVFRGRVLTILDFLGKYMLANLFVICLMGVAMSVDRSTEIPWFVLPPGVLSPGSALQIRVRTGISSTSVGSVVFVISLFFSLVIGQVAVVIHQWCDQWEAELHARQSAWPAIVGGTPNPPQTVFQFLRRESLLPAGDAGHGSPMQESLHTVHNSMETLVDHVFRPEPNLRIRLTPFGKMLLWLGVMLLLGMTMVSLAVPIFEVEQKGVMGDFVVPLKDHVRQFSLFSLAQAVSAMGWSYPAVEYAGLLVLFCGIFPVMRIVGLVLMMAVPTTVVMQKRHFDFLEVFSAWCEALASLACAR
jgi:hypothetical protein